MCTRLFKGEGVLRQGLFVVFILKTSRMVRVGTPPFLFIAAGEACPLQCLWLCNRHMCAHARAREDSQAMGKRKCTQHTHMINHNAYTHTHTHTQTHTNTHKHTHTHTHAHTQTHTLIHTYIRRRQCQCRPHPHLCRPHGH